MQEVLSVEVMRRSDAAAIAAGTPGRELMRRAGEAVFRAAEWPGKTAIVCGKGNNAGDGYVLGTLMAENGIPCELLIPGEGFSEDGRYWFDRCTEKGIPVRLWQDTADLSGFAAVADCIFGTGFRGDVSGEAARMIDRINESGAYVVSVDINSGLNGDSGMAEKAVRSDLTVSVGSWKPGHFLNMAMDLMKRKVNCDIGIAPAGRAYRLMEEADARAVFPERKHFANKGTYGYLALIGGSLKYSGAVRLAAASNAAMRAGAGVVKAAVPRSLCPAMIPLILESTLFPLSDRDGQFLFRKEEFDELLGNVKTAAFGMGIGNTAETRKAVRYLLETFPGTLIIDADGLNALAEEIKENPAALRNAAGRIVLTPHPGEFARLSGKNIPEIQQGGVPAAEAFAAAHGVTLLLKGPATVVTDGQETWIVDRGCPGMATAGSGDVLSGILAAVCAGNAPLSRAAAAGAWINGRAGEMAEAENGPVSMTAGDTVRAIAGAIGKK